MSFLDLLLWLAEVGPSLPDLIASARPAFDRVLGDLATHWTAFVTGGMIGGIGHVVAAMAGACVAGVVVIAYVAIVGRVLVLRA